MKNRGNNRFKGKQKIKNFASKEYNKKYILVLPVIMLKKVLIVFLILIGLNIAFKVLGFAVALIFKLTVFALFVGAGAAAVYFVRNKMIDNK